MSGSAFPVLKAIGVSTLVLHGEDDQIVPICSLSSGLDVQNRVNVDRFISWYRDLMALPFSLAMAAISLDFQEL
ncbi:MULTISPECIES: hypothetical protein [Rhizobium]|uniref:hypothetical protein n=1 Tax=Rhizobium TaxID=379 RepID=UPI0011058323|nr:MULTISPECIES: hypothetical protein [Rhizobium]NNU64003.1 hypothetical protein [Rhizobium sp. WYCCWR 11152]NYT34696.1 hypothetical protein [Rhizobium sp. WYCCWR 11128]QKK32693.1 hypothetical protein FE844_029095 [Rhizobium indicum]